MPNTKSAERRMRSSASKHLQNRSIKSRLHSLERQYVSLVTAGKKEDATALLSRVNSAYDRAAKTGAIHESAANRKKSRLRLRLNRLK